MTDDRLKALAFDRPETIPIGVGFMPSTWMHYREELDALVARHPVLFENSEATERDYDAVGGTYVEGEHTDRWGCVWSNVATGFEAIVTHHPVPTRESVHTLKAPGVIDGSFPHGFMYLRLADLRGFEELMIDFAEEPPELQLLIDTVLDYNMKNLEVRLRSQQDKIIVFGDDLGMQHGLPMGPEKWRTYLKPCFAEIYAPCRDKGHYVYMHTDGDIIEIIPDLVDCGVNVVNAQIGANGLDKLVAVCKGKVCVDLDLDRQLFPFCTPRDIDDHVRESVEKLGSARGGLWLFAWCGPEVPLENIEAICASLEKYRTYFS